MAKLFGILYVPTADVDAYTIALARNNIKILYIAPAVSIGSVFKLGKQQLQSIDFTYTDVPQVFVAGLSLQAEGFVIYKRS